MSDLALPWDSRSKLSMSGDSEKSWKIRWVYTRPVSSSFQPHGQLSSSGCSSVAALTYRRRRRVRMVEESMLWRSVYNVIVEAISYWLVAQKWWCCVCCDEKMREKSWSKWATFMTPYLILQEGTSFRGQVGRDCPQAAGKVHVCRWDQTSLPRPSTLIL